MINSIQQFADCGIKVLEQAVSRIVARSGQICRYMAGSGHNQPEIKKQTEEDPTGKRPPKGAVRKDQGQQNNVITKMSQ